MDGPLLLLDAAPAEPATVALPGGTALAFTRPNPEGTGTNQDAVAILPTGDDGHLLVVADGMGGTRQGGEAAASVVRNLIAAFDPRRVDGPGKPVRTAVLDAIEAANAAIQRELAGSGTTLAAVELGNASVRPYHVGDSSILVFGQRGKLKLQTVSHSPVGFAVEAGMLDEEEALHHDELHYVSNMIGSPEMRIELGAPLGLSRHDTLLIASDGLTDNVATREIIELARKGPLEQAAARLIDLATARMLAGSPTTPGKPDDLSLIAFRRDG